MRHAVSHPSDPMNKGACLSTLARVMGLSGALLHDVGPVIETPTSCTMVCQPLSRAALDSEQMHLPSLGSLLMPSVNLSIMPPVTAPGAAPT